MNSRLQELRDILQSIDEQILDILQLRNQYIKEVGEIKKENNLSPLNEQVANDKEKSLIKYGKAKGLKTKFIRKLWRLIHHDSVKQQKDILGDIFLLQQIEEKKLKIINKSKKKLKKN